jgi:adenylate cyclase class 2
MNTSQEIEAKFYVKDSKEIESRIRELDARLIQPRVLETNIRFDLFDDARPRLRSEGRVLRLRQDTAARLTYKGAGQSEQGIVNRTEIEFTVEDFEKAKSFLEALGYQKLFEYEKFRTTYLFPSSEGSTHVMLDELPYGDFVEIEGESIQGIHSLAEKLKLNRIAAISMSYSALFERLRDDLSLTFKDLTFANFERISISAEQLRVQPADQ